MLPPGEVSGDDCDGGTGGVPFVRLTAVELVRPCLAVRAGSCAPGTKDFTSPDLRAQNEAGVLMISAVVATRLCCQVEVGESRGRNLRGGC